MCKNKHNELPEEPPALVSNRPRLKLKRLGQRRSRLARCANLEPTATRSPGRAASGGGAWRVAMQSRSMGGAHMLGLATE